MHKEKKKSFRDSVDGIRPVRTAVLSANDGEG